ncbi:MAG: CRTAC1 family protein [Verrucomicrobiota bacterium]|nr:CRTAC1 family protein [Verrucomicrobiota bacterium]
MKKKFTVESLIKNKCILVLLVFEFSSSQLRSQFIDATEKLGFSGGGKAAFADYNNDGFVDIHAGALFMNDKGTKLVPASESKAPGGSVVWGDFDNDGNIDLFQYTGAGSLHRNKGDGTFEKLDFPKLPTVNSMGAVWIDINNDGLIDLYVGGYEIWQQKVHPDAVFINLGNGKFKEEWRSKEGSCYSARGVCASDFNEDGYPDVYVSNYRLQPNHLLINDGKGKLNNLAEDYGTAGNPSGIINYTGGIKYQVSGHTIGSCFDDLDNDGLIDLFVGNFSHPRPGQDHPQFLRNRGSKFGYKFEDKSSGSGLAWQESFASPSFGDFDNDGDLDLYFTTVYGVGSGNIKNFPVLYSNEGQWKFSNVTSEEGLQNLPATYQSAWADIDNDGDLDLCTAGKIFQNNSKRGNWIKIKLSGDGKNINRSAIGSIVKIRSKDSVMTRHVQTGTGEGNQSEMTLHFGLGNLKGPLDAEILWPGKVTTTSKELKINSLHKVIYKKE